MRVHELAKELGMSSKALMDLLGKMKVPSKSHSGSLDDAVAERVRQQVKAPAKPAAPAAPARIAKTPTGERILGMRKIVRPPVEEAPAAPVVEPSVHETPPAAPAPVAPAEPVRAKPAAVPDEGKKPKVESEPPVMKPAARAPAAPAAPKAPPKEIKTPVMPSRPMLRPVPPRKEAPRPMPPRGPVGAPPPPSGAPAAPPLPRGRKTRERLPPPPPPPPPAAPVVPAEIELTGPLGVGELAAKLDLPGGEVVKRLLEQGVLAGINQQIALEVATKVVESFGSSVRRSAASPARAASAAAKRLEIAKDGAVAPRPPVVTIMGHVDHGKTTLLDAIRQTDVAGKEFGGITQHIGASTVDINGRRIVFIDTPGHEAFTTLRARGAQVTDIAVLVVAADDGVMPQTIEALNHAKAAGVPVVVAINKIDQPQANPDRVKQQLSELGLVPEDWGGDTVTVPASARTKQGVKELLEMILLVADLQELRADPDRPARGTILEAELDKGRGPVATVLVQEGTLRIGDAIVAGEAYGRVRAMANDRGERLTEAGPATPVEVVGLDAVPQAGDLLEVVRDDKLAKAVAEERHERARAAEVVVARPAGAEEAGETGPKEVRLIIKADTHGSVEALTSSLARLAIPEVGVTILHAAVGNVAESDVMLAAASRAAIVGFNVRPEAQVRKLAEQEQIEILTYRVIYEAIEDLQKRLRGLLAPKRREVSLGQAEVRQT
ncbi:MAG: translation initiation factor IF-2, partial [Armatimonadetes bacterium]|nr:translation initiation factor IF-2 [Armatimonadota bacterium]